jgi:hypothetical protein
MEFFQNNSGICGSGTAENAPERRLGEAPSHKRRDAIRPTSGITLDQPLARPGASRYSIASTHPGA